MMSLLNCMHRSTRVLEFQYLETHLFLSKEAFQHLPETLLSRFMENLLSQYKMHVQLISLMWTISSRRLVHGSQEIVEWFKEGLSISSFGAFSKTATIVKELDEDLIEYAITFLGELSELCAASGVQIKICKNCFWNIP
jgi:hypothetical protein